MSSSSISYPRLGRASALRQLGRNASRSAVPLLGLVAIGFATGRLSADDPASGPPPVTVALPEAPMPAVTVVSAAPVVKVDVPVPSVNVSVPEPAVPEPPRPRAAAPRLYAECVAAGDAAVCEWDDGFPAISSDGKTIAMKYFPDDGGRGNPGLSIRFIDPSTSKVERTVVVLSPDEWPGGEDGAVPAALEKKLVARVARVQRVLDAGNYRSLVELGSSDIYDDEPSGDAPPDPPPMRGTSGLVAEITDEGHARIVDVEHASVVWQQDLVVPAPRGMTPDDECSGWQLHHTAMWWDPSTRYILASQDYSTGGCLCTGSTVEQVRRMPS